MTYTIFFDNGRSETHKDVTLGDFGISITSAARDAWTIIPWHRIVRIEVTSEG